MQAQLIHEAVRKSFPKGSPVAKIANDVDRNRSGTTLQQDPQEIT